MKYVSLKDKKQQLKKGQKKSKNEEFRIGFEKGIDESFDLFSNFIDLYKKYKNDVKLLMNEQKPIWTKWVKYYENQPKVESSNYLNIYNEWLFNHIFCDIDDDSESFLSL